MHLPWNNISLRLEFLNLRSLWSNHFGLLLVLEDKGCLSNAFNDHHQCYLISI